MERMTSRAWVLAAFVVAACSSPEKAPVAPTTTAQGPGPQPTKSLAEAEAELSDRIRGVVLAQRGKLRACYEEGLARSPALAGRVVLVLEVGQDGMATHVFEARREGLGEPEVACFARVLKATRFHDGAGSAARIQIPLAFSPDS
jgi:hypothetical protein